MKYNKSKSSRYFRKQRIYGGILAALGILSAIVCDGDITAALLLTPFGIYLMLTREMWVTDDYYYEVQAKKNDRWPR